MFIRRRLLQKRTRASNAWPARLIACWWTHHVPAAGTLRRNPELKWRFDERDLARVNGVQSDVLRAAARLIKRGGRLIYATCSLLEWRTNA